MSKVDERHFFDSKAGIYDSDIFLATSEVGQERIRRRANSLVRASGVVESALLHLIFGMKYRVLELGCGTGEYTRAYQMPIGITSVAMDISPEMVKLAHTKAPNTLFVVADAEHLPFRKGCFDAVIGNAILHHLPDLDRALDEILYIKTGHAPVVFREPNLLSPGKFFAFAIPIRKLWLKDRWSPNEKAFSREYIRRKLRQAGFIDIEVIYCGLVLPRCPKFLTGLLYGLEKIWARIPVVNWFLGSLLIRAN